MTTTPNLRPTLAPAPELRSVIAERGADVEATDPILRLIIPCLKRLILEAMRGLTPSLILALAPERPLAIAENLADVEIMLKEKILMMNIKD